MKQRNIVYADKSKSDKLNAAIRLLTELEVGELSARENGWINLSPFYKHVSEEGVILYAA